MRRVLRVLLVAALLLPCSTVLAGPDQEIPSVNAGLGGCTASFLVHDGSGKPIYDAKINTTIRYGFLNKRQTEVQVGTNSDGKARVTGLPNFPKTPLDFQITHGDASKSVTDDPSNDCVASFDVTLASQ